MWQVTAVSVNHLINFDKCPDILISLFLLFTWPFNIFLYTVLVAHVELCYTLYALWTIDLWLCDPMFIQKQTSLFNRKREA